MESLSSVTDSCIRYLCFVFFFFFSRRIMLAKSDGALACKSYDADARDGWRFIAGRVRPSRSSPTNCEIVTARNWTTTTMTTTTAATSAGNFWGTDYLFSRSKVLRPDPEYYRPSGPLSDEQPGVNELCFGSVPQTPFPPRVPVDCPPLQLVGPSQ